MSPSRARVALAVLFAINLINFFDRQILGVVGEAIRREWALTDTALGQLATAFTLVYAVVGLPFGRLADRLDRTRILGVGVLVWSVLTAAAAACTSYAQLVAVRIGVGLGEASCAPAASSLIGDIFPAEKRSNALSIFMLGLPCGVGLSYLVGGHVARAYGWKAAFLVAAAPGLACALAAVTLLREPLRGGVELHDVRGGTREGSPTGLVLRTRGMWPIIVSGAMHNFNTTSLSAFLASFLIRYHHVDIARAGTWAMFVYGLSGVPGLLIGGAIADRLTKRGGAGARMGLACVTFGLAAPLTYAALEAAPGALVAFAIPMGVGMACMYVYYSATYSTIHDLFEPQLRGTAMAIYFCAMYLGGAALGPLVMGKLSDHFLHAAALAAGVTAAAGPALEPWKGVGLHRAMYLCPAMNLGLCVCMYVARLWVPRDIERLREWSSAR